MAISWNGPQLGSPIRTDVPELQKKLIALLKQDPTSVAGIPSGAKRLVNTSGVQWQVQQYNGSSWAAIGKLMHDVDKLDGYHAAITPAANTVAVRNADKKLEGDITGNAATASSAATLSRTLPVANGGTGATTSARARTNLGVPPTSHASSGTAYGLGSNLNYGHVRGDGETTKIVTGEVVVKDVAIGGDSTDLASERGIFNSKNLGSVDYNTILKQGFYTAYGTGSTNGPGGTRRLIVLNDTGADNDVVQIAVSNQPPSGKNLRLDIRAFHTTVGWIDWTKFISEFDVATSSTPGIIKPGTGMTVDKAGALNVNMSNASTPGIVKSSTTALAGTVPLAGNDGKLDESWVPVQDTLAHWIGVPRYWRSTNLPPNHCWANGDFVSFADWPELKAVYDAGGFEGMLLPWDASSKQQAANLGKWRPDAADPTGLYTPNLVGQFLRVWGPEQSERQPGSWQGDALQGHWHSITDDQGRRFAGYTDGGNGPGWGAGYGDTQVQARAIISADGYGSPRVAIETRPVNISQPVCIYLGKPNR